jgi:hypothetical protein
MNKYLIEFKRDVSEENIKKMPELKFKSLVKTQANIASISYHKHKQTKCEKGSKINYYQIEIQDYLTPSANLTLEDQQLIFSLRCEMNPLKVNLSREKKFERILLFNAPQKQ